MSLPEPTFLSLFSGIGGFDLALKRVGFRCIGQAEIDPFCNQVLERRFPGVPRWGDVRDVGGHIKCDPDSSGLDLLCGGFPCQDLSVAGKRAGLTGERSGLFWEIVRIAKETKPTWGFFENVPGLLSSHHGKDMWLVLSGLRECWPVVGYRIFDSRYFGVAQRRRRVFFACGPTNAGVEAVLFESQGSTGDSAAGGEAGAGVANTITEGTGRVGSRGSEDGVNIVAQSLAGRDWRSVKEGDPLITHTLKAEGHDGGEDGTGRGVPIVPIQDVRGVRNKKENGIGIGAEGDPMFTLDSVSRHGIGVRRLSPVECERLQAFPDGWTCLCEQEPCICPDSLRYRALGNAVTVSVAQWIGERLLEAIERGGK